jgi:hypothetical protein
MTYALRVNPTGELDTARDGLGSQIVDAGVLLRGDRAVQLTARESKLVALLVGRWPTPVPAKEVARLMWPKSGPTDFARRTALMQLRRRLSVVGLALRCRTDLGYTLEVSPWFGGGSPAEIDTSLLTPR